MIIHAVSDWSSHVQSCKKLVEDLEVSLPGQIDVKMKKYGNGFVEWCKSFSLPLEWCKYTLWFTTEFGSLWEPKVADV